MIYLVLIHIISWLLAAICNAVMDTLQFHYESSVFLRKGHKTIDHEYFWDPRISWRNKYKGRLTAKGPRFFGSTTIFVFVTDAWHLAKFGMNFFITITLVTGCYIGAGFGYQWFDLIIAFIVYRVMYSGVFELFFSKILKKVK